MTHYVQLPINAYKNDELWQWVIDHTEFVDWYGTDILGFVDEGLLVVFKLKFEI